MKFQYVGVDKQDPEVATVMGVSFKLRGEPVFVEDAVLVQKLKGNPTFKCLDVVDVAFEDVKENLDALRAECDKRGIKYHHKAGAKKLTQLLEAV